MAPHSTRRFARCLPMANSANAAIAPIAVRPARWFVLSSGPRTVGVACAGSYTPYRLVAPNASWSRRSAT